MDDDNVVEISDLAWTPEFTLRRVLDFADGIEEIAIVMKLKDDSLATALSSMRTETLAMLSKHLDVTLNSCLREPQDDDEYY